MGNEREESIRTQKGSNMWGASLDLDKKGQAFHAELHACNESYSY